MAAKKKTSTNKGAKKISALMTEPQTAVMLAFSSSAEADSDSFFECVEAGFDAVGTNIEIDTEIIWAAFSAAQVRKIGRAIERCLDEKGFDCPPLAGSFEVLRTEKRTMLVPDLIQALIDLTTD
jgi:hypothetical protein